MKEGIGFAKEGYGMSKEYWDGKSFEGCNL
mgnify:CR=1 FL=1